MKIRDIRLTPLFSKFKTTYVWAMGKNLGQTTILVEIETDAGVVGYGETAPTMTSPQAIHTLLLTAKTVLLGQPITQITDLMKQLFTQNFGHHYASQSHPRIGNIAFAGVELALWDALGKSVGLPVHALLGGKIHDTVSFMGFVQGDSTEEVAAHASQLVQDGFEVIYLKAGHANDKDMANVEAVRKAIGNKRLRIDPNEAWDLMEAQVMLQKLAKYDLEMVEQPVSAISGVPALKALKQSCSVPIAADQSVFTPEEAHAMCASGAASLLTVGLHETGGILGFRRVAAIAQLFDINVCLHGVWETGITTCASIQAVAGVPNLDDGNQIMWQLLEEDIVENPDLTPNGGKIAVMSGPGLGFSLNEDAVGRAAEAYSKKNGMAVT
ncbi:mandelate racemase/muconate lactonizing enzyme family protein [Ruegeria sp. HKCCD8929]|uniref:mandelate racemase/muconate lactonizing enzyme family protein n=1 Tax=Ruegeria sp. HKCCD8929 TaxID=2683006 RepID=UPI0014889085|nr:mandelate racemase/muconate lactonizing enzyme family protein [Ruegeria sp. HKCCD8929]